MDLIPVALFALSGLALGGALGIGFASAQIPTTTSARTASVDRRLALRLAFQPPPADRAPGWYADPLGEPVERLWDGEAWTAHIWSRGRKR